MYPWQRPELEHQRRLMTGFRRLQSDPNLDTMPNLALLDACRFAGVEPNDLTDFSNTLDEAFYQGTVRPIQGGYHP